MLEIDVERPEEKGTQGRPDEQLSVSRMLIELCNGTGGLLMKAPRRMATVPQLSDMRHPAPNMPLHIQDDSAARRGGMERGVGSGAGAWGEV